MKTATQLVESEILDNLCPEDFGFDRSNLTHDKVADAIAERVTYYLESPDFALIFAKAFLANCDYDQLARDFITLYSE